MAIQFAFSIVVFRNILLHPFVHLDRYDFLTHFYYILFMFWLFFFCHGNLIAYCCAQCRIKNVEWHHKLMLIKGPRRVSRTETNLWLFLNIQLVPHCMSDILFVFTLQLKRDLGIWKKENLMNWDVDDLWND